MFFYYRQSLYWSGTGRCYLGKSWNESLWAKGAFWLFFSSFLRHCLHNLMMWSERIITPFFLVLRNRHSVKFAFTLHNLSFEVNALSIGWLWSVARSPFEHHLLLIIFFLWRLSLRYSLQIRIAISYSITAAMIIFWCFPGMYYLFNFGFFLYTWHHSLNSRICRYHLKHLYRLQDCSLPRMDMQASDRGCWYHLGMSVFFKKTLTRQESFFF